MPIHIRTSINACLIASRLLRILCSPIVQVALVVRQPDCSPSAGLCVKVEHAGVL